MTDLKPDSPKLRAMDFRECLLRVHRDLLKIHGSITWHAEYGGRTLTCLEEMVLVLEDRRFFKHAGIDIKGILREVLRAVSFRRHGGASTIDMQFVRTVTGYKSRTIARKIYEIVLASIIQYRYSKIVILRAYLDVAFFGSHLFGADRAAQALYGVAARDLSLEQAASMAAMLVYPRPLRSNDRWQSKVARRARYGMAVHAAYKKKLPKIVRAQTI